MVRHTIEYIQTTGPGFGLNGSGKRQPVYGYAVKQGKHTARIFDTDRKKYLPMLKDQAEAWAKHLDDLVERGIL